MRLTVCIVIVALALLAVGSSAQDDKECEVCVGVVNKFVAAKTDAIKDLPDYEKLFRTECNTMTHAKDKRLCWYLGAAKDSATNILREVSKPMQMGVPSLQICRRLKAKDSAICSLRYAGQSVSEPAGEPKKKGKKVKKVDWVGLRKMKVKELRKLLDGWGEDCNGCAEKGDFIKRIEELRPKYDVKAEL